MKVNNSKTIRNISFKTLLASKKRNIIAVGAIALTSVLFTVLFTMALSLVSSNESLLSKRTGCYAHGSFKEVTQEQIEQLSKHKLVKAVGERIIIGRIYEGKFQNTGAELSFMDENCAKWSFSEPKTGKLPEKNNEIVLDTGALEKLGIEPKVGNIVHLSFELLNNNGASFVVEDDFVLSGFSDYDPGLPVHYIEVSRGYVDLLKERYPDMADGFRRDLNVMMRSRYSIEKQMIRVEDDLGYMNGEILDEHSIRYGVNPAYGSTQLLNNVDAESILAVIAVMALIVFTGYLIIYNIFRISVAGDIRFYGLLKTIGVTRKQLKRIIRYQAAFICVVAIPAGLLAGYLIGMVLTPIMLSTTSMNNSIKISTSPLIFVFSSVFSLVTVLISVNKPGKMAGKVTPIEAIRYTEVDSINKKEKRTWSKGTFGMALANFGRNKGKTALVLVSLSLSVVLLTVLASFVKGFDREKYMSAFSTMDFIVGDYGYFDLLIQKNRDSSEEIDKVAGLFESSLSGRAYNSSGTVDEIMTFEQWYQKKSRFSTDEQIEAEKSLYMTEDGMYCDTTQIEGFDRALFSKFRILEGNVESLYDKKAHNIALNVYSDEKWNSDLKLGDQVKIHYVDRILYIDKTTGKEADEKSFYYNTEMVEINPHDVTYTVTVKLEVPHVLSERHTYGGNRFVLPSEVLEADSGIPLNLLFYAFDARDEETAQRAEEYLHGLTVDGNSSIKYESKASLEEDFKNFKTMFTVIGGVICMIIGLIGALNFINTILTGVFARQKELAVLQAVGMTGRQMKKMLVYEGLLYTVGSCAVSIVLALVMKPFAGKLFENLFWFYTDSFMISPILLMIPVFAGLGALIPLILYRYLQKKSVVERLTGLE